MVDKFCNLLREVYFESLGDVIYCGLALEEEFL